MIYKLIGGPFDGQEKEIESERLIARYFDFPVEATFNDALWFLTPIGESNCVIATYELGEEGELNFISQRHL